jgi:anti-sigma regulatory factor (Ser/Thr protein kinase)
MLDDAGEIWRERFHDLHTGHSARTGLVQERAGRVVRMEVATSSVLQLPYTASSVGVARRHLIGDLTGAGVYENTACDAGLVLSELISNALRHATPLPGRTVKVSWSLRQDSVKVAVSDGGGPTVPMENEPTNWSVGGRGLGIVARLSLRWGVGTGEDGASGNDPGDDGNGETTVWAEVPVRYGSRADLVTASSRNA